MKNGLKIIIFIFSAFIQLLYAGKYENYLNLIEKVEIQRDSFHILYGNAGELEKKKIIKEARKYLIYNIKDSLFNYWYGTPWDFYGTTTVPGKGKIACGYFVTTVLQDAGFKIPRIKWAQLASENMILRFSPENVKRFPNKSFSEVQSYLIKEGEGLYLTGLDCHVGFLFVDKDTVLFIHSNYFYPKLGVMSERIAGYNPFYLSRYRVVSKLFSDEMIVNWICSKKYLK
jgi:hypothetical protein